MTNQASDNNKSTTPFQFDASAPSFVPRAQCTAPSAPVPLPRTFSWADRVKHGATTAPSPSSGPGSRLKDKTVVDKKETLVDKKETLADKKETFADKKTTEKKKSVDKKSTEKKSTDKRPDKRSSDKKSDDRTEAAASVEEPAAEEAATSTVGSAKQNIAEIIRPPVNLAKLDDKLAAAKLATSKAEQGKKKLTAEKPTVATDKSGGSSEKTQPASEDLDEKERPTVVPAQETTTGEAPSTKVDVSPSDREDAKEEIKEATTLTTGQWNTTARLGIKRTESRRSGRGERSTGSTALAAPPPGNESARHSHSVQSGSEPARHSYSVESMLELRTLPECQSLKVKPGMEWILTSTGAGGDSSSRSLNTLLEYRNSRNTESTKFQVPAAIARKGPAPSSGSQDDWSRRKKEELIRTSSAQKNLPQTTSRPLPEVPEDSWQVQQQKAKDGDDRGVKVIRRLRAQLNKMTPKTYDSIFKAILDIGIDNVSEAEAFVNIIFEKAITNHNYIDMYADLCGSLELELQQRGVFCSANKDGPDFKRLLIQQCQNTFQLYLATDFVAPETADEEEAFELLLNHKKKMKGNLMFVACLAQSQLVQPKILLLILNQTLDTKKSLQLEALASFLPSCAPAIAETKRAPAFFQYLERCKEAACDAGIEQRVRFLLQDAIEQIEKMGLNKRPQQ